MTAAHRWYPTAQFGRWRDRGPQPLFVPNSVVHAKEMGTAYTACGQAAATWRRFWEDSFPSDQGDSCPQCLERVARG